MESARRYDNKINVVTRNILTDNVPGSRHLVLVGAKYQ